MEDLGLFVVSLTNTLLDLLWSHSAQILGVSSFLSKSRIFRSVSVPPFKMLPNLLKNSGLRLSWLKTLLWKLTNIFLSNVQCYFKISSSLALKLLFILPSFALFVIISRYFDHSM